MRSDEYGEQAGNGDIMSKSLFIGCIADDFTGASDAASFLAAGGLKTLLYNGVPQEDSLPLGTQAVVVALKTRTQDTCSAVQETLSALRWLMQYSPELYYIKYCSTFDSTPQGNIGPICDAVMLELNTTFTLLCPSLPANGRTVEKGVLFVNGTPLHETHMRHHPLTPMWDSRIKELMKEQSIYPCYVLNRETISDANVQALLKKYAAESERFYLIPDYATDEDSRLIVSNFGKLPLLTGGSGLLEELARQYNEHGVATGGEFAGAEGRALVLAGSCSTATQAQVRYFLQRGATGIMLEPELLLSGRQSVEDVWNTVSTGDWNNVIVYTSGSAGSKPSERLRLQHANALEQALSKIARRAIAAGYTRLIVAGGETSGAVIQALGISGFFIGHSIAPGVPVLKPIENGAIRLVLKSGNFGQEDFFERAIHMTGVQTNG